MPIQDILDARRKLGVPGPAVPAFAASLPASQTIRLAIGALGLPDDNQNAQLVDLVTAELSGAPGLQLVERQSLDEVLAELQLSLSRLVRARDAVAVGKLLRADWFLLRTETSVAGTNSLVARVVDARTGILRDAGVFVSSQPPTRLASDIADFIRRCRDNASSGKRPVYLRCALRWPAARTSPASRYRTGADAWDIAVNQACSSLVRDSGCLFVGRCWNHFGEDKTGPSLGLGILDLSAKTAPWRELKRPDGLPPGHVTALAPDGGKLWVGGFGYIALMQPAKDELLAVADVQAESVDRLQPSAGFL